MASNYAYCNSIRQNANELIAHSLENPKIDDWDWLNEQLKRIDRDLGELLDIVIGE